MNKLFNFFGLLAESTSTAPEKNPGSSIAIYVVMIVLVVLMLVLPMITQKKRNKEYAQMLDSLHVGDTIKTIGGVIGRVTKISEKDGQKSFILETGAKGNKTTMEFDIASVAFIVSTSGKKVEEQKVEESAKEEKPVETPVATESETAPAMPAEEPKKKAPQKKTTKKSSK